MGLAACRDSSAVVEPGRDCAVADWVGAWAAAPSDAEAAFRDQTLRLIVTPLRGGSEVRVLLSNRLSASPLSVGSAYLGKQADGPRLVAGSNVPLTFDSRGTVTIAPGREVRSDPVAFAFSAFDQLAVSLYLPGEAGGVTKHHAALQTSFVAEPGTGNLTADESGDGITGSTTQRPIVMGIEVLAPGAHSVVVAIGDSITDGYQQAEVPDLDERYPDYLAARLAGERNNLSVVNLGIGGNRVLRDGLLGSMGPALLARIEADVLARSDVSNVILLEGINDLGLSPRLDAAELIAGLQEAVMMLKAPRAGRSAPRVLVGTLLPAGGAAPPLDGLHGKTESRRQQVNAAIRRGDIGDGHVDFDLALRDPADETRLAAEYDSGDGLHPSSAGYARMAAAVDLAALADRDCR